MILDVKCGVRGVLVNADTSERIPHARWANTETGEYEALVCGPDGKPVRPARVVKGRCRLKFIQAKAAPRKSATPPDAAPPQRKGVQIIALAGVECDEPKCHRLATWRTAIEQEIEPEVQPDGLRAERAKMIKSEKWCAYHYRWPRFTSLSGVEREVEVIARPQ